MIQQTAVALAQQPFLFLMGSVLLKSGNQKNGKRKKKQDKDALALLNDIFRKGCYALRQLKMGAEDPQIEIGEQKADAALHHFGKKIGRQTKVLIFCYGKKL